MSSEVYTGIGFAVIWCIKYIFIPIGVSVFARIIADKVLLPQPESQRKKRFK